MHFHMLFNVSYEVQKRMQIDSKVAHWFLEQLLCNLFRLLECYVIGSKTSLVLIYILTAQVIEAPFLSSILFCSAATLHTLRSLLSFILAARPFPLHASPNLQFHSFSN